MTTKVMLLPSKPNRELVKVIQLGYISEEFGVLANSIATWIANPLARNNEAFNQTVFKTLNTILLDNVMSYAMQCERFHFATVLGYNQFMTNCIVRVKYLDDLMQNWAMMAEHDKDESEEAITHFLLVWLNSHFQKYHQEINAALLQLHEQMIIQTPYRYVRNYRFEIDPELRPLLIYTDCIDEAMGVH